LGIAQTIPVIFLDHLTAIQAKAYMLADNNLTDRSTWDEPKLAVQLKELSDPALEFGIEATGFEAPEIDFRIQSLEENAAMPTTASSSRQGPAISQRGDVWSLGGHKIHCGNALENASYVTLMTDIKASAVFTDPPYNVKIDGHVSDRRERLQAEAGKKCLKKDNRHKGRYKPQKAMLGAHGSHHSGA
jgi:hypothetical protein